MEAGTDEDHFNEFMSSFAPVSHRARGFDRTVSNNHFPSEYWILANQIPHYSVNNPLKNNARR